MTHLSPAYDKIKVAKNCWDKGYESAIKQGKLDYVIRIEIPVQELDCFRHGERVVFLYHGQLVLRHYRHEFITCNRGNDKNDNSGTIALGVATGIVGTIALLGLAAVSAMKWGTTQSSTAFEMHEARKKYIFIFVNINTKILRYNFKKRLFSFAFCKILSSMKIVLYPADLCDNTWPLIEFKGARSEMSFSGECVSKETIFFLWRSLYVLTSFCS